MPQQTTLAWEVMPGTPEAQQARFTGLEQTETLPPVWSPVVTFAVPQVDAVQTFSVTTETTNQAQAYWRAFTR